MWLRRYRCRVSAHCRHGFGQTSLKARAIFRRSLPRGPPPRHAAASLRPALQSRTRPGCTKATRDYVVHSITLQTTPSAAAAQQRTEQGGAGALGRYCCHQTLVHETTVSGVLHTAFGGSGTHFSMYPSKLKDSIFSGTVFFFLQ